MDSIASAALLAQAAGAQAQALGEESPGPTI